MEISDDISCILDVHDIPDAQAIPYVINIVSAIRIASSSAVWLRRYVLPEAGTIDAFDGDGHHWGHYDESLTIDTVEWVDRHLEPLSSYFVAESYSRVANAIRLHGAAMTTGNSDLALLGCVGAIESLFSIPSQELSFRLSLLLARFLGDDSDSQREYFKRARELYSVRSKIAHGDKIHEDEEQASIQMAERWAPEAEEIARLSLRRIVDKGLFSIFNSPGHHDALLLDLLFEQNLGAVLAKQNNQ